MIKLKITVETDSKTMNNQDRTRVKLFRNKPSNLYDDLFYALPEEFKGYLVVKLRSPEAFKAYKKITLNSSRRILAYLAYSDSKQEVIYSLVGVGYEELESAMRSFLVDNNIYNFDIYINLWKGYYG